jgi:dipeptidase E
MYDPVDSHVATHFEYSTVALALEPADGHYILASAWIGVFNKDNVPFPQSSRATERSVVFWKTRAFVYGSQEIIEGTETTAAPWW